MIPLSPSGEIASFQDVDQFQPVKTQFACGFFACALVKSMAQVGHHPTQTASQMIAEAEQWYAQYDGNNSISNTDGMSLQQLYKLLAQIGLHYVPGGLDTATPRAWLHFGYPILAAGLETSFYDMGLGDVVPYPWHPTGNHIIVLTGVASDGNFLVRDTANVTNLYNPNTLRPGPRKYDAAKMRLVSATVIVPPWLPTPPADFDPTKEKFVPIIPAGWHDDGVTLTAPNGHKVVHGFRDYVLKNHWQPGNLPLQEETGRNPLEESNPSLGAGTQQVFRWTMLEWTPSRGVFIAWIGQEFLKIRGDNAALQAEVADLESKLKAYTSSH
ncbi:MAG TPA: hypothetical protein VJ761_05980 [Ktedonobacteraceae bacterium]|nr:hypothetical protein [Ktedonobacteraceae bacterium]